MTVSELIKQLRKMPKDAPVYWQDHDHSDTEWNAEVRYVGIADMKTGTKNKWSDTVLKGKIVMLRP